MKTPPSHAPLVRPIAPETAVQAAGLYYVLDTQPGIRRQRAGRGFCYRDRDGKPIHDPADVRTWAGTVLAAGALRECGPCGSPGEATQRIAQAMEAVAKRLGNSRAVCRACYVHPTILEAYLDGSLCALPLPRDTSHNDSKVSGLHPEEALVLTLLKQRRGQPGLLHQQAS